MGPRSTVPSGHQSYMLSGYPLCWFCGPFYCGKLTTVGVLVHLASPFLVGCHTLLVWRLLLGEASF